MQVTNGGSLQSEINVTPLVDVVLVLLIIFMVVVPLLLEGYDVGMPKVSAAPGPPPSEVSQLILSLSPSTCPVVDPPAGEGLPSNCRVTLGGRDIPVSEVSSQVAMYLGGKPADEHVLFLAAEDGMNYEGVLRIVDMARSGVDDLRIEFLTTD
jgi:biopolymer transport protein ExbD